MPNLDLEKKYWTEQKQIPMKTESELIQGINSITEELKKKKITLKELSSKPMSGYKRKLILEIEMLKGQRRTLEHMLIIG